MIKDWHNYNMDIGKLSESRGGEGIDIKAQVYREGRSWKVNLELPRWAFEDMLIDSENDKPLTILGRLLIPAGYSSYQQQYKPEYFVGICKIEIAGKVKEDDETEPPPPRQNPSGNIFNK